MPCAERVAKSTPSLTSPECATSLCAGPTRIRVRIKTRIPRDAPESSFAWGVIRRLPLRVCCSFSGLTSRHHEMTRKPLTLFIPWPDSSELDSARSQLSPRNLCSQTEAPGVLLSRCQRSRSQPSRPRLPHPRRPVFSVQPTVRAHPGKTAASPGPRASGGGALSWNRPVRPLGRTSPSRCLRNGALGRAVPSA